MGDLRGRLIRNQTVQIGDEHGPDHKRRHEIGRETKDRTDLKTLGKNSMRHDPCLIP